jgi:tape measure domain-containing protein
MASEDDILLRAALRDELTAPLQHLQSELSETQKRIDALGKQSSKTADATEHQTRATKEQGSALERLAGRVTSTDTAFGRLGKRLDGFVNGAASKVVRWAKFALVGALGLGARSVFQFAQTLEQARNSLTNLLGSSGAADRMIGRLKDFAKTTPFNFDQLVSFSQQLVAVGFNADRVVPTMQSLGDATAALGGGNELLGRLIRNLGQMQSAQKISTRDMNDFATSGLPIWDLMATKLGITTGQLRDMISTAGGGAKAFKQLGGVDGITALIGERFRGGMDAQMNTFQGAMSNFVDTFNAALEPLATRVLKSLTASLKDIGDWLGSPQGQKAIDDFSSTLIAMWPTVAGLGKGLLGMAKGALIVAKVLKPFTPLLVMAGAALLQMLVVHKVAKGIQAMKLAWTLLKAAFVTNPLGMTVIALVAIGAGLVYAYKHSKTFRDIVKEIGDKLHAAFDWVAEKIKGIVGWIDTLVTKMTGLRDRLAPDPGGARSMMSPARVSKRVAAMDAAGARGGTIDDQIRAGFAAGDRRTPYPRRGFDRGHLSRSLSLYGAAASMTPGRQVLTLNGNQFNPPT